MQVTAARRANALDVMGMWIVDDGTNVATWQTGFRKHGSCLCVGSIVKGCCGNIRIHSRWSVMFGFIFCEQKWCTASQADVVGDHSGCKPPPGVGWQMLQQLQRVNTTHLEMVCAMAATNEPWFFFYKCRCHNAKTILSEVGRDKQPRLHGAHSGGLMAIWQGGDKWS